MTWKSGYGKESATPGQNDRVVVYGTSWCGMTQIVRRYLDRIGVPYKYIDLDAVPGALNQLRWLTGGYANHPTVIVDGQAFIEPSMDELERVMVSNGYI